jgi:hypothetical protein
MIIIDILTILARPDPGAPGSSSRFLFGFLSLFSFVVTTLFLLQHSLHPQHTFLVQLKMTSIDEDVSDDDSILGLGGAATRPPAVPAAATGTTASRQLSSRGASWTDSECLCLVKAWISVSEDPLRGTYQKAEDFYKNLGELFNKLVSSSTPVSDAMRSGAPTKIRKDRPCASVKSKWYEIQKHVNKFVGISTTTE